LKKTTVFTVPVAAAAVVGEVDILVGVAGSLVDIPAGGMEDNLVVEGGNIGDRQLACPFSLSNRLSGQGRMAVSIPL